MPLHPTDRISGHTPKPPLMRETGLDYRPDNTAEEPAATVDPAGKSNPGNLDYKLFLRHRWFVLSAAVAGAIVLAVIALLIPSRYESSAQLMPPDQNSSAGMLLSAATEHAQSLAGIPGNLLGTKTSGALFIKIMASETVAYALIRRFDLRRVYRVRYWESARKELEANTSISDDRKSGIITIRVRDKDRDRARNICQAYVDELNALSSQLSNSSARREREFLEQRLAVLKQELDQSAGNLGQFSSKNTTFDIPQQSKVMVEGVATLQGQLIAAESELKGMKQTYGDQNVRVRALQSRIAELRRNVHLLTGQISSAPADSDLPYPSIRKLPLLGVAYSDLLRRTKIDEAVYEALTKQYEIAKVQEVKDTPSVRLLDPPSYPERHVFPPRLLMIALGGLAGLLIGIAWVAWAALHPEDSGMQIVLGTYRTFRDDLVQVVRRRRTVKETSISV